MVTQYYIAWEKHMIFTSREELVAEYVDRECCSDYVSDYLSDRYTMSEVFDLSDSEKESIRSEIEDGLWENIVSEWDVDALNITSDWPVSAELERL